MRSGPGHGDLTQREVISRLRVVRDTFLEESRGAQKAEDTAEELTQARSAVFA